MSAPNPPTGLPLTSVPRDLRLSDRVAQQLTDAIMSGQLAPGSRLPSERELGDQLKVSRTVIREAVRSLAALGLVTVTSGRGVEVANDPQSATPSMRLTVRGYGEIDYSTVHEVRVPIEVHAAGLAAKRAGEDDVQRLRDICDRHAEYIAKGDLAGAVKEDLAFHNEIASLSGNVLLKAMYASIAEVLNDVRTPARHKVEVAESGLRAHRWLLDCLAAHDEAAARSAMDRHLADAERIWRGENKPSAG
jgi:GntR family transcriptional repressor for pyruvate dehydrogenase complex